jgi:exopolysaccharide production protein ExoZ
MAKLTAASPATLSDAGASGGASENRKAAPHAYPLQGATRANLVSIQFLRFVAATSVVLFHSVEAISKYLLKDTSALFLHIANFGASGVHIFFVISGFIMVYTSFSEPTSRFEFSKFVHRRATRIYPIYIIYCGVYLAIYNLLLTGKHITIGQSFWSLSLWPGYSSLIIGPGWTLSFEIYFYLAFAIAMLAGLRLGLALLTIGFLVAVLMRPLLDTSQPAIHVATNPLLIEFLLGAWIGYAFVARLRVRSFVSTLLLAGSAGGFLVGVLFGYRHLPTALTWGVPSALLVAGLAFRESNGPLPRVMTTTSFLGDSSYSLYLLHILLIDLIVLPLFYLLGPTRSGTGLVTDLAAAAGSLVIAAICVVAAVAAYELVERKITAMLQRRRRTGNRGAI